MGIWQPLSLRRVIVPKTILALIVLTLLSKVAAACPLIDGFVDYNCDGIHKIAITGDSVVKGVRDTIKTGGYVTRLGEDFPFSHVYNLGVPGITSHDLFRAFKDRLDASGDNVTKQKTYRADIIVIDLGRNDYWLNLPPSQTIVNIRRLVSYLRKKSIDDSGSAPQVIVTRLVHSSRGFQQPFINEVNRQLLLQQSSALPSYLDLTRLKASRVISYDGIHPSSRGYDLIAQVVSRFIKGKAQSIARRDRPDRDRDGVYDFFEATKFYTDPAHADSDGDGYSDGVEIFVDETDPLDPENNKSTLPPPSTPTPTPTATPEPSLTPTPSPTPTVTPTVSSESK